MLLSWLGTDRFGGKSQRRDATADRFASRHDDDDDDEFRGKWGLEAINLIVFLVACTSYSFVQTLWP